MNKVLAKYNITLEYRQRRRNIALTSRLLIVLAIIGTFSFSVVVRSVHTDQFYNTGNERKLLSTSNGYIIESVTLYTRNPSVESLNTSSKNNNELFPFLPTVAIGRIANCSTPAINEFPSDGFDRSQRKNGWVLIHILMTFYFFWFLAVICDVYFVPAIVQMCLKLRLQEDIVGATFMAAATSSPELFINCVGTFITKGDIGVGTIVGSAVFNILAVPACCGIFAGQMISLDWWPVTRDCMMYCLAVLVLIFTLNDGIVMWYEALFLALSYFLYIYALYWNDAMARKARKLILKVRTKSRNRPFRQVNEITPLLGTGPGENSVKLNPHIELDMKLTEANKCGMGPSKDESLCSNMIDSPWDRRGGSTIAFLIKWPMTFVLWVTMPDSRRHPNWHFLTFIMAIAWIGTISYMLAYLITIVGDTLNIPDSVMGLTILAAGMSVPEAVSSVIVTTQGHGQMGISNSIGSNTFDILLCLGIPWFIKAFFVPTVPEQQWVVLNSSGLTYSVITLLATLFGFYIAFAANKFRLDWKTGVACSVMYVGFLVLASMIELNFFFKVNLPVCDH